MPGFSSMGISANRATSRQSHDSASESAGASSSGRRNSEGMRLPLVWVSKCRKVTGRQLSFSKVGRYLPTGASRSNRPCWARSRIPAAVTALLLEAMRKSESGLNGVRLSGSRKPKASWKITRPCLAIRTTAPGISSSSTA